MSGRKSQVGKEEIAALLGEPSYRVNIGTVTKSIDVTGLIEAAASGQAKSIEVTQAEPEQPAIPLAAILANYQARTVEIMAQ